MAYYAPPGGPPPPAGFGGPRYQRPPPPGANPQLWQWFTAVDSDNSGNINAEELKDALVNGDWTPFDLDTVKMIMSMFDTNRSGTIDFNEFSGVWNYIQEWQRVFRHFDGDHSGKINARELENAMSAFKYNLSPQLIDLLIKKYASGTFQKGGIGYGAPGITFDRFVRACVVVRTLTESFQRLNTQGSGHITLNYDQFLNIFLSAP